MKTQNPRKPRPHKPKATTSNPRNHKPKNFLRMIPNLTHYSDRISDIPSGSFYGLCTLTFYLTLFLARAGFLSGIYSHILSNILYSDIFSGIYSDILCGILPDILFWHSSLSGPGPARSVQSSRYEVRRRAGTEAGEKRRRGAEGGGKELRLFQKTRDPQLTGREPQKNTKP